MQINEIELEAIIFDLGGVILDIDYQKTIHSFESLGFENFNAQYSKMKQSGTFDELEKGLINEEEFIFRIKKEIPNVSDEDIILAWNALLLNFSQSRIDVLKALKPHVKLFLLSNTNEIHLRAFNKSLKEQIGLDSLNSLFDEVYLSHEIKMRKPDKEPFEHILKRNNLKAENVLFIDDSPQHVATAKSLGLHAIHLESPTTIEELFAAFLA